MASRNLSIQQSSNLRVSSNIFNLSNFSIEKIFHSGKRAVLGFDDGSVKVIDLSTGGTTCKFEPESTQLGNVVSIAVNPDNNLIAVGAVNSKLGIFKTQQPKVCV